MELAFLHKAQEADAIWSFYFKRPPALVFEPGDYLDVELAYPDSELGGRRWLSISSAPHQPHVRFTVKVPEIPSQFKKTLLCLEPGQTVQVSPPIGTFHLPRQTNRKVLWIAGGIGITPYLAMSEHLHSLNQSRDITCKYYAKPGEHLYLDLLQTVAKVHPLHDRLSRPLEVDNIDDYEIYMSGPEEFCMSIFEDFLLRGVPRTRLHLDYFPGYSEI